MPNVEIDGTNSTVKTNVLTSQSGTTITVPTGKVLTVTDAAGLTVAGNAPLTSIADNSITLAKMAGGTDGQIITYDASGDPVAVGPGTDGQVLTSTGAGSPPAFEAAAGGGLIFISSVTASNVAGVNFLTSFSATYDVYIVRYCDVTPVTDGAYFGLRIAQGGSVVSASQYRQVTTQRLTSGDSTGNGETGSTEFDIHLNASGNASGEHDSGEAVFYNPLSTSSFKSVGWQNSHTRDTGSFIHNVGAGSYWSTTATTGFQFRYSTGNVAAGTFRLYGIVNS